MPLQVVELLLDAHFNIAPSQCPYFSQRIELHKESSYVSFLHPTLASNTWLIDCMHGISKPPPVLEGIFSSNLEYAFFFLPQLHLKRTFGINVQSFQ